MKFIPGPIGTDLSGKLGGTVASHNRGGSYLRRRAKPVINTSEAAEAVKESFATVSAAWSSLEDAVRKAWTEYASSHPVTDRIGQKITLDGHAMFVKCNARQEAAGGTLVQLPPVDPPPVPLLSMSVHGIVSSSHLNVALSGPASTISQVLAVRAAITESAARNYVKGQYRLCGYAGSPSVSQIDVLTLVQDRLGTLQNGNRLHVALSVYDQTTGLESMQIEGSDTVSGLA